MKRGLKSFGLIFLGFISGFLVQEYAIQRHELIKKVEKEALKEKIKKENQILIRRLEEDFEALKDSITQVLLKKKEQFIGEGGEPPDGLKQAMEMRFNAEKNRILAEKRKEVDRKIEDLEMRLDF
jgi:hypothetical protein